KRLSTKALRQHSDYPIAAKIQPHRASHHVCAPTEPFFPVTVSQQHDVIAPRFVFLWSEVPPKHRLHTQRCEKFVRHRHSPQNLRPPRPPPCRAPVVIRRSPGQRVRPLLPVFHLHERHVLRSCRVAVRRCQRHQPFRRSIRQPIQQHPFHHAENRCVRPNPQRY